MSIACQNWDLAAETVRPHWYTTYTCANHEKRIAEYFSERRIEHFLPLYQTARRWKDRTKVIQAPLFPSYIFVRIDIRDRLQVLNAPGVVRIVGFSGLPAALPDEQIDALRKGLLRSSKVEPHPYPTEGRNVRVKSGPFEGLEGILVRHKGDFRVVLTIELIRRSVLVDVDAASIEILPPGRS